MVRRLGRANEPMFLVGVLADQDLGEILFAGTFQPDRQIDPVADHVEIHPFSGADIVGHRSVGATHQKTEACAQDQILYF